MSKKVNTVKILNDIHKAKTYKGEWYTVNSIFGNDWALFYLLLGGREAGKSYSAMQWGVRNKLKKEDKFKFYWFRLTEAATKNLLADDGSKFIDPDLQRKYNIKTFKKGTTIYTYTPAVNDKGKEIRTNEKVFCDILACSTFYNTKGVGYFDNEFEGEYYIVLDEMNREASEANRFDIVYNFVNLLENIARSTKNNIKVVMIGNTLDEASDLLTAFNFIPDRFGRFKLKSKRAVIDNIRPNEKYLERRKGTIADILSPNASTFTNEIDIDRSMLTGQRLIKPSYIIKFNKTESNWFTVWDGKVIKGYNGEKVRSIAMKRYLDDQYNPEAVKKVYEMFDARAYSYKNLADFKKFQKQLRLLKK